MSSFASTPALAHATLSCQKWLAEVSGRNVCAMLSGLIETMLSGLIETLIRPVHLHGKAVLEVNQGSSTKLGVLLDHSG